MTTLYLDESKSKAYTIVSVALRTQDSPIVRKTLMQLRMKDQRRIHFVSESDSRRRLILSTLCDLGIQTYVYEAAGMPEAQARALCLAAVVEYITVLGASRIVLEQDDSVVAFDKKVLRDELFARALHKNVSYAHERSVAEPLLWVPDAVAWSFVRGGDWRRRADPMIINVRRLIA
ncbi:hypothetical protein [Cryobacterium sp. Y62]|uniref:hypothetical protein n=1 Tax=Cryobacterium sp. Y62 TaxID=2048284 RepID=UPI000CE50A79|nr:hypothetical protein [Cryobacterium sp. Y62]